MFYLHHIPVLIEQLVESVLQRPRQPIHAGQQGVGCKESGHQGLHAAQWAAGQDDQLLEKGFQYLAIGQRYRVFVMQEQGDPMPPGRQAAQQVELTRLAAAGGGPG
ncbi:hypothetical protein PFLmoz3_06159 [Pseudomonas fluorescens]|uniref:Uncharacterized protein n=1 Tax=Pseudomonas fluorescens TaxID=294 RepID=A0A109KPR2_PSEFL|nr:hypothetical protein PFLmoz3_06159 [Pseudomonas fluorescens]